MNQGGYHYGELSTSIFKCQDLQAIFEIMHNNDTQLQDMDQQLKIITTISQRTANTVDCQLPNATTNKDAETCLPNASTNIS